MGKVQGQANSWKRGECWEITRDCVTEGPDAAKTKPQL